MADIIKIRPSWEHTGTDENGNMVFEHTSEVFGEQLVADSREELKDKMIAKLMEAADGFKKKDSDLDAKRVQAKLEAKQRL